MANEAIIISSRIIHGQSHENMKVKVISVDRFFFFFFLHIIYPTFPLDADRDASQKAL